MVTKPSHRPVVRRAATAQVLLSLMMGCGSSGSPKSAPTPPPHMFGTPEEAPVPRAEGASQSEDDRISDCGLQVEGVQKLESFRGVKVPGKYWVDMAFEQGEWSPVQQIPMPYHHATRLELENVDDFAGLAAHERAHVRFVLELTSREIVQTPGRRHWLATYHARILDVCLP